MITCTRRMEFDAAHRVMEHESKCRNLHGHRYGVEVTCTAKELDALGRVIDFGVVKDKLGGWIDEHWDHTTILHEKDRPLGDAVAERTGQRIFYLPYNPTAENIARYLLEVVSGQVFEKYNIKCIRVRVYETPNCYADAQL